MKDENLDVVSGLLSPWGTPRVARSETGHNEGLELRFE